MPFEVVVYVGDIEQNAILSMNFFTRRDCGFSFADAIFKLEGEKLKCVNQDNSLCVTSCHAQRDTLLKAGEKTMMSCQLSSPVKYAEGMVEARSFDTDSILAARSLNCVSKGRYVVARCLNTSAAPV